MEQLEKWVTRRVVYKKRTNIKIGLNLLKRPKNLTHLFFFNQLDIPKTEQIMFF
jgi:hypothetical protein